jgi:hypothetical protein
MVARDEILPPQLKFRGGPPTPLLRQNCIQIATDAGLLLGKIPEGWKPSEFWIDQLVEHCREENDSYISHTAIRAGDDTPHSFTLDSLCEASATFCGWLDVKALEEQSLGSDGNLRRAILQALPVAEYELMESFIRGLDSHSSHIRDEMASRVGYEVTPGLWASVETTFAGIYGYFEIPVPFSFQPSPNELLDQITAARTKVEARKAYLPNLPSVQPGSQGLPITHKPIELRQQEANLEAQIKEESKHPSKNMASDVPINIPQSIGKQIEACMLECGWTAEYLAEQIGIEPRSVYRHISDQNKPSKRHRFKYCTIFSKQLIRNIVISDTSVKVSKRQ